jgi:RNA-directed DNA polymerase
MNALLLLLLLLHEWEAKRFLAAMRERLAQFKLELHPDKTRLIRFGRFAMQHRRARGEPKPETFDFLGFTHCRGQYSGGFKLVRLTIKKRMRARLASIRVELMKKRHEPVPVVGKWLRSVMVGYYNYYAVPGNMYRLNGFRSEVCRAWRFSLMRRSQRNRMTWNRFNRLSKKYLPPCRVVHPLPLKRFNARTVGRSRMQ